MMLLESPETNLLCIDENYYFFSGQPQGWSIYLPRKEINGTKGTIFLGKMCS